MTDNDPISTSPHEGTPDPDERRAADRPAEAIVRPGRRPAGKSFFELFPHLFLIPLLLVTIGVLVYLFFVAIAKDTRDARQILSDIATGGEHARKQDAYALAAYLRSKEAAGEPIQRFSREDVSLIVSLLEKYPEDQFLRKYLVLALGRAGQPADSLPVLKGLIEKPEISDEERASLVQALGLTHSEEAIPILLSQVRSLTGDDRWELRLYSLAALMEIWQNRTDLPVRDVIAAELRRHVGDPRAEISWHSAFWLATRFADPAGIETLEQLSDAEFLDRHRGDRGYPLEEADKEKWMLRAVEGLYSVDRERLVERLPELRDRAREKRWATVLNKVNQLLEE
ncbi:MAG TPA: hypothetical protein VK116_13125, partial [Planctomycetota bacterium]|nr:hypothetical protein [Planctomycetota bacterium]